MIIFITGISSGFGRAMAARLSEDGHKIYGTYRHDCKRLPGVTYIEADVSDEGMVSSAVSAVLEAEGRIDVFINNAGMGIGGPIEYTALDDVERQMNVNWMGFVRSLHYILPVMRKQGSGRIICLSSIGGLMGLPFQGFYSASKFAIEGTAEALRLELDGTGIKVIVVEPGDFNTGFTASRKSVESEEALAAYPSYKKYLSGYEGDEMSGLTPEILAAKISAIVKSRNPSYRYVIATPVQKFSVYLKRLLPDKIYALILKSYYK